MLNTIKIINVPSKQSVQPSASYVEVVTWPPTKVAFPFNIKQITHLWFL